MFFRQNIRTIPTINPNYWSFVIHGSVRHPLIHSLDEVRALPAQTFRCAVTCAGMSSNRRAAADHPLIGEADWHGVPLSALLDRVEIDPAVRYARLHAADGYITVLPLERLAESFLVYAMNDAPLPPEHGFPARLIAPGRGGYKMPKWIERVELTTSPDGGFWEARGWSLAGDAPTTAAITDHQPTASDVIRLQGVAYAGGRAITALELSVDGGAAMPISFTPADPFTLTRWQIDWLPPGAGDFHVRLRASDGQTDHYHDHLIRIR